MIARAGLLAAALLLGTPAASQEDVDQGSAAIAADLAGDWQIVPTDGAPACRVTLGLAPARGGWQASAEVLCAATAPAAAGVAGWTFEDGMRLLDATGATLMRFEEDETALPSSPSVAAPAFYLVPAIPGFARLRQPAEWEGTWQITTAGQKPCVIRFGPHEQRDALHQGGSVTIERCRSKALARMDHWFLEGMQLMLAGPDDAQIAFAPDGADTHRSDDGRWRLGPGQGLGPRG